MAELLVFANFLHFVGQGLILPTLAPYIFLSGGNNVTLGILGAGIYSFSILSSDIVVYFKHSHRFTLRFTLIIYLICFMIMVFTSSYWILIIARFIQAMFNQITSYSKLYVDATESTDDKTYLFNLFEVAKTCGISIGAILGGHVFYGSANFHTNAILAATATLMAVLCIEHLQEDPPIPTASDPTEVAKPNLLELPYQWYQRLTNLRQVNYQEKWDLILLQTTFVLAFGLYFTRFALLVFYNYQVGIVIIGYHIAYQNMLLFVANHMVPLCRKWASRYFDHILLFSSVMLVGIYYAPTYECYLIIFVPLVLSYSIVNDFLIKDIFDLKKDKLLTDAFDTLNIISNTGGSLVFGVLCQLFGGAGFKVLTMLPIAVCIYQINRRLVEMKKEENKED